MPGRAIEAMSAAMNALPEHVSPAVYASLRRKWVAVERHYLALLAEQERLHAGLARLCECPPDGLDASCPACELLRG